MTCPDTEERIYIGDTPLIKLDSGIDLTGATTLEIKIEDPSGTITTHTATIVDLTFAQYQILTTSILNAAGIWKFIIHAVAPTIAPNWQGHGEPHKEYIYALFSDQVTT